MSRKLANPSKCHAVLPSFPCLPFCLTPYSQEDDENDVPPVPIPVFLPVQDDEVDYETNFDPAAPVSTRESAPFSDYANGDKALACAFPHIFLLGMGYHRSTGNLTNEQTTHLFTQFHQAPARDRKLLAFVFDCKRRTETLRGMKVLAKGNSKAFQTMDEVVNTAGFQGRLEAMVKHPDHKESKALLKTLHGCLTIAGKSQLYGSHALRNVPATIKEHSKSLGSPALFLTGSLDSKNNPRAFRLSKMVTSNRTMPAHLPDQDFGDFIEQMTMDSGTPPEINIFPFPVDESARAKEAVDNPVAYVQEFMSMVNSLLSVITGLPPENFFGYMSGRTIRKSVYLGDKSVAGRLFSYFGVVEANNRGDLHFHLVCFGSVPPHVLTNFARDKVMREKIADVLATFYTTQLDVPTLVYKATKDVMHLRKRQSKPVFVLEKQTAAHLLTRKAAEPLAGLTPSDSLRLVSERTKLQATQQQMHDHKKFTCAKGIMGKTGCRFSRPFPLNDAISVVKLVPRKKVPATGLYDPDDGGEGEDSWIATEVEDSTTSDSASPADALDRTVYYWDLARPRTDALPPEPFEGCTEYLQGLLVPTVLQLKEYTKMVASALCSASPLLLGPSLSEMEKLHLDDILEIYTTVSKKLEDMNGKVVEHSPLFSYMTGSHNNFAILGSSEQGKAAAFYLGPYFAKEKFGFEESLQIMAEASKHIVKFKSQASDSGQPIRNTKYFLQRCLNRHCLKMEVSDYQMAASLLGMPVILRSNLCSYVDPYSSASYLDHQLSPPVPQPVTVTADS